MNSFIGSPYAITEELKLLHGAIDNPEAWLDFLSLIRFKTQSNSGSVQIDSLLTGDVIDGYFQGFDAASLDLYQQFYCHHDIWSEKGKADLTLAEQIHVSDHLVPQKEYLRSTFYNEWAKPLDIEYAVGCFFRLNRDLILKFTLQRDKVRGSYGDKNLRLYLKALAPHVAATFHASQHITLKSLEQAVHQMSQPCMLIDMGNRFYQANQFLRDGNEKWKLIHWVGDKAQFSASIQNQLARFSSTFLMTAGDVWRFYCESPTGHPIEVGLQWANHTQKSALHLDDEKPLIYMFFHDMTKHLDTALLRRYFQLTPSEAEIAGLIFSGLSIKEISMQTHRSEHTLRSALKYIHQKCRVNRQAELVSVIAASPAYR